MNPIDVQNIINDIINIRERINHLTPGNIDDVMSLNGIKEASVVLLSRLQGLCTIKAFRIDSNSLHNRDCKICVRERAFALTLFLDTPRVFEGRFSNFFVVLDHYRLFNNCDFIDSHRRHTVTTRAMEIGAFDSAKCSIYNIGQSELLRLSF